MNYQIISDNNFGYVIFASLIAATVTTLGILTINKFSRWGEKNSTYFLAFASGSLISVSFLHIIPEALEKNSSAPPFLLAGFLFLHVMHRFLKAMVCRNNHTTHIHFGITPVIAIAIHSFIDGIIYSVTFSASIFTGVLTAVGLILHEFPEGLVTFLLLKKSGFSNTKSSIIAFLAAALTTPLGMLISWPFISKLTPNILGILLAFSAGALLYVGSVHLLPEIEKEEKKFSLLAMFTGILIAILIVITGH